MQEFQYAGINLNGKKEKGIIKANTRNEALNKIRARHVYPQNIKIHNPSNRFSFLKKKKISKQDLSIFSKKISVILKAGIPIVEALETVESQIQNKDLKEAVTNITKEIKKGKELSESMEPYHKIFPYFMINMIKSGEMTGNLDTVFQQLSFQLKQEYAIKRNIKKELTPAVILIIVASFVSFSLIVFVLPTFIDLFNDFGVELPLITRILLNVSFFFKTNILYIFVTLVLLSYVITKYKNTEKGKLLIDRNKTKIPIIGNLIVMLLTAQFSLTFSSLIKSGVPIHDCLTLTGQTIKNHYFKIGILNSVKKIEQGLTITESLASVNLFPEMFISMISIGDKTGKIDEMLETVYEIYAEETKVTIERMLSLLNPVITLGIAAVVFLIILAVAMPMFELYSNLDMMG